MNFKHLNNITSVINIYLYGYLMYFILLIGNYTLMLLISLELLLINLFHLSPIYG